MPKFTVPSRVDAFVDYVAEVEAEDAAAAEFANYDGTGLTWEPAGTVEFDARHVVALDADGEEIEATAQGKF
jgi:hypothetical protein